MSRATSLILAAALAALTAAGCHRGEVGIAFRGEALPVAEVSPDYFYTALEPYGNWIALSPYGEVWQPRGVPLDWRPYTCGRWQYTDEFGWVWDSDWDWGWAAFHYGRWVDVDDYGWVWVPGTVWGPAWVAWRTGGGYIGWAPLPPGVEWRAGVGLIGFREGELPWRRWVFVRDRDFYGPIRRHVINPSRNVTFLHETRLERGLERADERIVNRGLPVRTAERFTGRRVERMHLRSAPSVPAMHLPREQPNVMPMYRPQVSEGRLQPPAGEEMARRQAEEMTRMRQRHQEELAAEQRRQEAERQHFRGKMAQLRQRQQQEHGAMMEQHQREERLMTMRHQRETRMSQRGGERGREGGEGRGGEGRREGGPGR